MTLSPVDPPPSDLSVMTHDVLDDESSPTRSEASVPGGAESTGAVVVAPPSVASGGAMAMVLATVVAGSVVGEPVAPEPPETAPMTTIAAATTPTPARKETQRRVPGITTRPRRATRPERAQKLLVRAPLRFGLNWVLCSPKGHSATDKTLSCSRPGSEPQTITRLFFSWKNN